MDSYEKVDFEYDLLQSFSKTLVRWGRGGVFLCLFELKLSSFYTERGFSIVDSSLYPFTVISFISVFKVSTGKLLPSDSQSFELVIITTSLH